MRRWLGNTLAEAGAWLIERGIDVAGNEIKGWTIAHGNVSESKDQRARHLEAVWIEREQKLRAESGTPGGATRESDAVRACRQDLQHEFGLVRRLGPGPMTEAESAEYLKQERAAAEH